MPLPKRFLIFFRNFRSRRLLQTKEALCSTVQSYSETTYPNSKRISNPSPGNWAAFLTGELSATTGMLLSCPSTNITMFNIESSSVKNMGCPFDAFINFIGVSELMSSHGITNEDIFSLCPLLSDSVPGF